MKDEIKEIINYVNNYRYNKECKNLAVEDVLTIEEAYKIIDYITNLQERNEKAIEYIKKHIKYECDDTISGMSFYSYHLYDFKKEDLLNILNGGDDNE